MSSEKLIAPIGIILISIQGNYRSPSLREKVLTSGIPFIEIDASTPLNMRNLSRSSSMGQLMKIGRLLTPNEIATYETHLRAQTSEFSKSNLWTVVFEDDAVISDQTVLVLKTISHIQNNNPLLINLFPNRGVVASFRGTCKKLGTSLIKVEQLYSGAVAYAFNNAAQRKIEQRVQLRVITPADFPPHFNTFEKYICVEAGVEHPEGTRSTIYEFNKIPSNNKILVILGFFSALSFILFRKEHVSFKNYLDIEIRQRFFRRRLMRQSVSFNNF
jgi:GR25 family glycosyltransferase involved in LPS biosynthesis